MELTKPQVKALLNVMAKDTVRPTLCNANISLYQDKPYLVACDSYALAALRLPAEFAELEDTILPRDTLMNWYKLAKTKDVLNSKTIRSMLEKPRGQYPNWQRLIPEAREPQTALHANPAYMVTLEALAAHPLAWEFTGKLSPLLAYNAGDLYVLMPLRP